MGILEAVAGRSPGIKKVSSTGGGEYAGPCPVCGGEDRFRVWPEKGRFWCRTPKGCGKGGDLIEYFRWAEGMNYPEACRAAGADPKEYGDRTRRYTHPELPPEGQAAPHAPAEHPAPDDAWRAHAEKFAAGCRQALLANPAALARLAEERGLTAASVARFGLGLNPADAWRDRASWGLPPETSDKTGKPKRLWLPRGLVIPTTAGGDLIRLKIRRPAAEADPEHGGFGPRYYFVPGSSRAVMRIGDAARAYVVVESELDALLIAQEAGELAGVIALGTAGAKPDAETAAQLAAAAAILVALDFDEAGERASAWWLAHYRQAVRWPPAAGKDPGEFFRAVDVRAWVLAGLPPAWHVAAPVGPLPGEAVVVGGAGLEPAVGAGGVVAAQTAPEAPESVREMHRILSRHPVRIVATAGRLAIQWRPGCERPDDSRRLSGLVFFDEDCAEHLARHPAGVIDRDNFWKGV
jgi:DNA primase